MAQSVIDAISNLLDKFSPRTFQSDNQAGQFAHNLSMRAKPGRMDMHRFVADFHDTNSHLRAGEMDPSTKKFVDMMDATAVDTPNDLILSRVVGPDAFGLDARTMHADQGGLEDFTGKLIADRGYSATSLGTPPQKQAGQVTMTIATPAGTRVNLPRHGQNDRLMVLNRDQEYRVTKVEPDGQGGYNMFVVATERTPGETPEPIGGHLVNARSTKDREAGVQNLKGISEQRVSQKGPSAEQAQARHAEDLQRAANERITNPPQQPEQPTPQAPQQPTPQAPGGPAPREGEPIVSESIGGQPRGSGVGGNVADLTEKRLATPTPERQVPVTPSPVATSMDFRRIARERGLESPSPGPRRAQFNKAFQGITTGKGHPEDIVRDLNADIEHNRNLQDQIRGTGQADPALDRDIKKLEMLRDAVREYGGLGNEPPPPRPKRAPRAKKAAPELAKVIPIKKTEKAPEAPKAPAAKPAAPKAEPNLPLTTHGPESRAAIKAVNANKIEGEGDGFYQNISKNIKADNWSPARAASEADKAEKMWRGREEVARGKGRTETADSYKDIADRYGKLRDDLRGAPVKKVAAPAKKAAPVKKAVPEVKGDNLDSMTKAQLLDHAKTNGIQVRTSWTKDRIKQEINASRNIATEAGTPNAREVARADLHAEGLDTTIPNLKKIAKDENIDIKGKTRKADIQEQIRFQRGIRQRAQTRSEEKIASQRGPAKPVPTGESNEAATARAALAEPHAKAAKALALLEQNFTDQGSEAALRHLIDGFGRNGDITPGERDHLQEVLISGNRGDFQDALDKILRDRGIKRIGGRSGDIVPFQRGVHRLNGPALPEGTRVQIMRPGYETTVGGHRFELAKPEVMQADVTPQVNAPAAQKLIESKDRRANFDEYWRNQGFNIPDSAAGRSVKEIRQNIATGKYTPDEGIRRLENDIDLNKQDLADIEREMRGDISAKDHMRLKRDHERLQEDIKSQEEVSDRLRQYFKKDAPVVTPQELMVEVTPEQKKALEVATPDEIKEAAKRAGLPEPKGNTKEEMLMDLVRTMGKQELERRAAKKAVKKVAPPKAPATPKPDLEESPYTRLDANALAEGLDLTMPGDKTRLAGIQDLLDGKSDRLGKSPTPAAIGRDIENFLNGVGSPFIRARVARQLGEDRKPGESDAEFKDRLGVVGKEVEQLTANGNDWKKLADRLKNTRRVRKEHAPETSTKTPTLSTPEKADIAKVAEATGIPEPQLAKKALAKKAAEAPPKPDAVSIVNTLKTVNSREEGHTLLQGRTKAELMEVAKASGVPTRSSMTKPQLSEAIVNMNVGARLDSQALRNLGEPGTPMPGSNLRANLMNEDITSRGDLTELEDRLGIKRGSLNREDRVNAILEAMQLPENQKEIKKLGVSEVPDQIAQSMAKKATKAATQKAQRISDVGSRLHKVGTEGEAIRILAAEPLTSNDLKTLANDLNIQVPPSVKSKGSLQLHIAQELTGNLKRARGIDEKGRIKGAAPLGELIPEGGGPTGFSPATVADRIGELQNRGGGGKFTKDEVSSILEGNNLARLRQIATAMNVQLPRTPPGGQPRWTQDLLREYIAMRIFQDKDRFRLR